MVGVVWFAHKRLSGCGIDWHRVMTVVGVAGLENNGSISHGTRVVGMFVRVIGAGVI